MSTRKLEIEMALQDEQVLRKLKSSLGKIESESRKSTAAMVKQWAGVAGVTVSVAAAYRVLTGLVGSAIQSAIAQEDAINRLNVALQNQGVFTEALSREYQEMSSVFQRSSRFADEAILEVQQQLIAIGGVGPAEMGRVTQAVLDFATATGRDLNSSVLTIAKAMAGYTGELSRYGIILDQTLSVEKKRSETLKFIEQRFGGAAQADLNTYSGATAHLANAWGDFLEEIGNFVIKNETVIAGIKQADKAIVAMTESLKENKEAAQSALSGAIMGGLPGFGASVGSSLLEQMFGGKEAQAAVIETVAETGSEVLNMARTFEEELAAIRQEFRETDFQQQLLKEEEKIEAMRQQYMAWGDEKTALMMIRQQQETEFLKLALDTQRKAHESFWPTVGKLRDQFSAGMSKMLTEAITGTVSWSDAFKEMGKQMIATLIEYGVQLAVNQALALALQQVQVGVSTSIAAATAAAWAPAAALVNAATFGAGAAAGSAALTVIAGIAQGIASIPGLEEGGITRSRGSVLVGEAGPEILNLPSGARVSPLDRASSGAVVNVNINVINPTGRIDGQMMELIRQDVSEWMTTEFRRL